MVDTGFAPTSEQCGRLMIGSGFGGAGTCVDTHATDGSGGLYSTGNDMARWLRHNLADTNGILALSHAVYRPRQSMPAAIGFDEGGPMAGLGLGWVTVAAQGVQPMMVVKSGGGLGFMSYIAFFYAAIFLIEGVGLYLRKHWAEYMVLISTGSLLPVEFYELYLRLAWWKFAVLLGNLLIVAYLIHRITLDARLKARAARLESAGSPPDLGSGLNGNGQVSGKRVGPADAVSTKTR